jgi:hypothetical protein
MAGKHHWNGKYWYVDSDFLNSLRSVFPGAELEHLWFGEFFVEVPGKGRIDFDRMRGEEFEGQVGRSHRVEDNVGGKLVEELIQKMKSTGRSVEASSKKMVAGELLKIARAVMAMDFPTQDAFDKYMKDHPDANRSNHKVVKHNPSKPETHPMNLMRQRKNEEKMNEIGKHYKKDPKDLTNDEIVKFNGKQTSNSSVWDEMTPKQRSEALSKDRQDAKEKAKKSAVAKQLLFMAKEVLSKGK